MRIIVLEAHPLSTRGGKETSMLDICKSLSRRGHKVELLYSRWGDLIPEYEKFCKTVPIDTLDVYKQEGAMSIYRFTKSLAQSFYKTQGKTKRIKTIVYVDDYHFGLFCSLLAWFKQIPAIIHIRHVLPGGFQTKHKIGLRMVDRAIAVSQHTKSLWQQTGGLPSHKIDVVYNGINPALFYPTNRIIDAKIKWNLNLQAFIISYVGRLDKEKNIETLIEACGLLKKYEQNDFQLIIAGEPVCHPSLKEGEKYKNSLQQLAIDVGIGNQTYFVGHVSSVISIYHASDITVLPSLSEPFGKTIIESMASGVPAIAANAGGIPEILGDRFQNFLYKPQDKWELYRKISSVLFWRQENPRLSMQCRQHVLHFFSLSKTVESLEAIFTKTNK